LLCNNQIGEAGSSVLSVGNVVSVQQNNDVSVLL
jgi:hypothetical protein